MDQQLFLKDFGIRILFPPLGITRRDYLALTERFGEAYPRQEYHPESFGFFKSQGQAIQLMNESLSISEIFDEDYRAVLKKTFDTLDALCFELGISEATTYDTYVSATYRPTETGVIPDSVEDFFRQGDFVGGRYLNFGETDYRTLNARKITSGLNWGFERGEEKCLLKMEPLSESRDLLLVDLQTQYTHDSHSLTEVRRSARIDAEYLLDNVARFLGIPVAPTE